MSEKAEAMTAERIAEIKAREGKATPGPWVDSCEIKKTSRGVNACCGVRADRGIGEICPLVAYGLKSEDAEFFAHARQDIPDLLAEVDRLRAENKRLERQVMQLAEAEQMRAREALIEAQITEGWFKSSQGGHHE